MIVELCATKQSCSGGQIKAGGDGEIAAEVGQVNLKLVLGWCQFGVCFSL
jgi:hypothetical protein